VKVACFSLKNVLCVAGKMIERNFNRCDIIVLYRKACREGIKLIFGNHRKKYGSDIC